MSSHPVKPHAEQQLRAAGLRVTKPRLAVLRALEEHPHSDTSTVIDAVRTRLDAVSHQAVYDCLGALTDAGLVRRIQPAGSVARYELLRGDNHHHLVCRGCGAMTDVACAVGTAPCLDVQHDHGFAIDEAEVIYWGLCQSCTVQATETQATEAQPTGAHPAEAHPAEAQFAGARPTGAQATEAPHTSETSA
jgi:Fur family transcriptional regulator, stress-responsive regulator